MLAVLIVGLLMNVVALPLAARRVGFLYAVISSGQPAPDRIEGVTKRTGTALKRQVVEVLGQKKLLKWSVPGAAHFFVMWAFFILITVYIEAYGSLVKLLLHGGSLDEGVHLSWAIPFIGHWAVLGFLQDFIAVMCLVGLATFVYIRVKNAPKELGRRSRFFGSHLGPAWFTLFMIFNVIWSLFLFRGAGAGLEPGAPDTFPYSSGAWVSLGVGKLLSGIPTGPLEVIEGIGLLLHIGVALGFLIFVLNSKHLHIFLAPLNVMFGRSPVALGAAKPMMSGGKALTLADFEDLDEDAKLGVGATEDFSWKGILDFATCTECGRCQDQCPAWNTEKPLSPKLLIMALRDSQMAKAPYLLADEAKRASVLEGSDTLTKEVERPLVGDTGDEWFYMPEDGSGVIDPDVLWSCVTCGACVNQCPVDIEHVDHIVDMRRYQVLVESNFPAELNGLFKGMESKGNPWNMSASARLDWAKDLPFDVKVVGEDIESLDEVDWLFWVGCAGAYEDRAKKTTRAVAELLDMAGVSFGVLGNGETCTGDSARRAGNEFLFQGLAAENIETFKEYKVKKVVSTCAHCFNTLKNEYKDLGVELEVVHHTQLLNRLVREKKLTPVAATGGTRSVTYHDPCYIGRHNQVYAPPRELLAVIPDADFVEMPRNSERSFCCGAGGARMWMEEKIGSRINETRTKEAVDTGADQIAVGCPFCRVMLSDGLTNAQSKGEAREEVEVLDVAQMLLASIKGEAPKKAAKKEPAAAKAGSNGAAGSNAAATSADPTAEDTKDEPEAGDVTQTEDTVTRTEDAGAAAEASGGSSLFDVGDDSGDDSGSGEATSEVEDAADHGEDVKPETTADEKPSGGGSLFDLDDSDDDSDADDQAASDADTDTDTDTTDDRAASDVETPAADNEPDEEPAQADLGSGGSLFDIEESDDPEPAPAAEADAEPEDDEPEDTAGDSTTDGDTDRAADDADADTAADDSAPADEAPEEEAPAPSSSGTVSTPATEIPEGGSLFDIEATEDEAPTTAAAETEEHEEVEDAAADSTTDGDTDRTADDADTATPEPAETSDTKTTTVGRAASAASDVETPEAEPAPQPEQRSAPARPSGTLFDIAAPRGAAPKAAGPGGRAASAASDVETREADAEPEAPQPEPAAAEADPEPEQSDVPEDSADDDTPIRSLKDIKAGAKANDPDTEASPSPEPESDAERDDEAEAATEDTAEADAAEEEPTDDSTDEASDKPKPASSGEAHTPKSDVEIAEGGSLFDL